MGGEPATGPGAGVGRLEMRSDQGRPVDPTGDRPRFLGLRGNHARIAGTLSAAAAQAALERAEIACKTPASRRA